MCVTHQNTPSICYGAWVCLDTHQNTLSVYFCVWACVRAYTSTKYFQCIFVCGHLYVKLCALRFEGLGFRVEGLVEEGLVGGLVEGLVGGLVEGLVEVLVEGFRVYLRV